MSADHIALIIINCSDVASLNQGEALRDMRAWDDGPTVEGHRSFRSDDVRMWYLPERVLTQNYLDRRWFEATGESVREAIFPSRHSAASGQASLTLHPIGIPHLPLGELGPYGGIGGQAPPPNSRLAGWWRMLQQRWSDNPELSNFDLSLEVTHHGPYLDAPSLFIEVGSTEATWGHMGAAQLLATIIHDGLFDTPSNTSWDESLHRDSLVLVTLGGGHYAPRANVLAGYEGVWLGHMLATYALPFVERDGLPGGTWVQSIEEAIRSTKQAFPGGSIAVYMDKKAFKGWQRQAIRDYLSANNLPLMTSKTFLAAMGIIEN
jgi:D-aminoacyl-tRNA deacylase